jgi:class 3 adenylate cyclase
VGRARLGLFKMEWTEHGDFVEGRWLVGERRFRRIFDRAGLRVETKACEGGCEVRLEAYVVPQPGLIGLMCAISTWLLYQLRIGGYLRAVVHAAKTARPLSPEKPAAVTVADSLPSLPRRLMPPDKSRDRHALAAAASRLRTSPADTAAVAALIALVENAPVDDLSALRPFELADRWQLPRREVLTAMLHATRAGLLDLRWQLDCPRCRAGAATASRLGALGPRVHCDECDIDFAVDFADNVEAIFSCHSAIAIVEQRRVCAGSPWFRPHVWAELPVAAGTTRWLDDLPPGPLVYRRLPEAGVTLPPSSTPRRLRFSDEGVEVIDTPSGPALTFENASSDEIELNLVRAGWQAPLARGSLLITLPEWHGLFGLEAPAAGHEVQVSSLCILFCDVVGSTRLYEQLGDARAYALVQSHFRGAIAAAVRASGAVVKTMGDGVLATFARPADAIAAGFDLVDRARTLEAEHGVSFAVRVGIHQGGCLLVNANERLDLFGSAVNLAARLQSTAGPNQVAVHESLLADPAVEKTLASRRLQVERRHAELKGLGHHRVAILDDAERRAGRPASATDEPVRGATP